MGNKVTHNVNATIYVLLGIAKRVALGLQIYIENNLKIMKNIVDEQYLLCDII